MNRIISVILVASFTLQAQNVEVIVENIRSSKGVISIGVFNNAKSFPEQSGRYKGIVVSINEAKSGVLLSLPKGEYVIGVYHDLNSNSRMDRNLFSAPVEPYGFSNNRYRSMGRPDYKLSRFAVTGNHVITKRIRLR